MPVQRITTSVGLVSPAGTTVATLSASSVTFSQDEGVSPFYTARVTVAMPSPAQFAMMKPGAGYYLSVLAYPETSPESVPLLLKITDRNRTTEGNVELQAASAEVELQSFTPSAVDRSNWPRQTNVPSIISDVLTKVFGTSWARYTYNAAFGQDIGTPTYPTYRDETNMLPNGSFEYGTTGWTGVNANVSQNSGGPAVGTYGLSILPPSGSSNNDSYAWTPITLKPNTAYRLIGTIRVGAQQANTSSRARQMVVIMTVGGVAQVLAQSSSGANAQDTATSLTLPFNTPAIMDDGGTTLRLYNGSYSAGARVVWDALMLIEAGGSPWDDGKDTQGTAYVPYFDGDTVDGTNGYNYQWQGTPGNSSSTRTAILARDQESLTWSPGQTAWDFLQPILQSVGVRLWSVGYTVLGGAVVARIHWALNEFGLTATAPRVLDTFNLFDLNQIDSWSAEFSDGTPMYADQVIIHYAWTDSLGVAQEAYDVYPATGKKPYYLDKPDTPFPGTGRAQGIYNRISARATIYQGTTWFNRGIEVGRQLAIVSAKASGGSVVGYVEAATHDPSRGTTEFRTKQTVAYTSASWFAATGSWASQTGSWAADQ